MGLFSFFQEDHIEAGCDEAGRGCLAGPVFAAAVILPPDYFHPLLNDSKQVSEKQRYELRKCIEAEALSFAVGIVYQDEIDAINILQASFRAMHLAVEQLSRKPGFLLIDGNRFKPFPGISHACIIKGDSLYYSIAAASILAKTGRDDYMLELHASHPQYNWLSNKGYPTSAHREAIALHGPCEHHRMSFRLLADNDEPVSSGAL